MNLANGEKSNMNLKNHSDSTKKGMSNEYLGEESWHEGGAV